MEETQFLEINDATRTINAPSDLLLGVLGDKDVERVYFRCPKIVGDNINLAEHQIYVKYVTAPDKSGERYDKKEPGIYHCQDVIDEGEYITFSWKLSGHVFEKEGFVAFSVLASDGEVTRWNTFPAIGTVLITIPGGLEEVAEKYPDIITQLLNRMDEVEAIATPGAMQEYVAAYLAEHPVELDETLTDNTKAAPAGMVGELKDGVSELKENFEGWTLISTKVLGEDESDVKIYTVTDERIKTAREVFAYFKMPTAFSERKVLSPTVMSDSETILGNWSGFNENCKYGYIYFKNDSTFSRYMEYCCLNNENKAVVREKFHDAKFLNGDGKYIPNGVRFEIVTADTYFPVATEISVFIRGEWNNENL